MTEPVRISGVKDTRDTSNDVIQFYLGDDDTILTAVRPKMAVLIQMVAGLTDDSDPATQAVTFDQLLGEILDTPSEQHVRARLNAPLPSAAENGEEGDDLDYDHPDFTAMIEHLVAVWYGARPTRGRSGSSGPSSKTGKRSTARSRSRGSTR